MPGLRAQRFDSLSVGGFAYLCARSAWRYLITGNSVRGDRTDNATFLHAATKDYRDRPYERHSGPKWQRLARRHAVLSAPLGWWLLLDHLAAELWLIGCAVAGAGWCVRAGWRRVAQRGRDRDFLFPVAREVCRITATGYRRRDARKMVRLPADFLPASDRPWSRALAKVRRHHDGIAPVRIAMPAGVNPAERERKSLATSCGRLLGMPDPHAEWTRERGRVTVALSPRRMPPAAVSGADVLPALRDAELELPVVGVGVQDRRVLADYRNDSPHILISGGSGTGKSVLVRALEAQRMHNGAGLIILDFKRISHRWAHNLPGCLYAWKIENIHALLVECGAELNRRIGAVVPEGADHDADLTEFQTVDIVVEEINALSKKLRRYWKEIKMPGQPEESPAFGALAELVTMGRELRMHVVVAGQRVSAGTFGGDGGDIRESFAIRFMAKWTTQTWKMLAGSLPYLRWPSGAGRGLWAMIVNGEEEVPFLRVPLLTNTEARELALSGVACPPTPLSAASDNALPATDKAVDGQPDNRAVTLSVALPLLPGPPVSLTALRKAASRGGSFPEAVGKDGRGSTAPNLYQLDHLVLWKRLRDEGAPELVQPGRRPAVVYGINTLDVDDTRRGGPRGVVILGYVGQTVRPLEVREFEHDGAQPWSDVKVGNAFVIWQGLATPEELDARELDAICRLKPLYNYEGQEGMPHACPKWEAVERRHARDTAAGRPLWEKIDRYVPGGHMS